MGWTAPRTWVTGETVTAAIMNAHVKDNLTALKAAAGTRCLFWWIPGTASTGTNKSGEITYRGPTLALKRADVSAKTGPAGADLIFDINEGGTSIWASTQANRVKIVDGETTGTQTSFDDTTIADGSKITVDVDQVGSGTAGADLSVNLEGEYTVEVS
ncbi:MAG: hypothetical protein BWY79_01543 [Actinobacteria bacterium ADurb.Bin444]|nr:MAG: hypothetical protein BWY79_01543 [Actinobacteria bacterium ADurb.Bin444]